MMTHMNDVDSTMLVLARKRSIGLYFSLLCLYTLSYSISRGSTALIQPRNRFSISWHTSLAKAQPIVPFHLNVVLSLFTFVSVTLSPT
jgi:hypothetical protein